MRLQRFSIERARHVGGAVVIFAGFMMLATGCAQSRTQAFLAPTPAQQSYDGFLAYGAFRDLGVEGRFEKALCQRLAKAGHACVPMLAVATPTKPQDAASRQRAAQTSGAQAIVIMELADPDTTSRQALANGTPAYEISLVDVRSQTVVARFAVEGRAGNVPLDARAQVLAKQITEGLEAQDLLYQR